MWGKQQKRYALRDRFWAIKGINYKLSTGRDIDRQNREDNREKENERKSERERDCDSNIKLKYLTLITGGKSLWIMTWGPIWPGNFFGVFIIKIKNLTNFMPI